MTHNSTARPLTFRDLQDIVARLASDPRVHPSTPIELVVEVEVGSYNTLARVTQGLGAVCLAHGKIKLAERPQGGMAFAQ